MGFFLWLLLFCAIRSQLFDAFSEGVLRVAHRLEAKIVMGGLDVLHAHLGLLENFEVCETVEGANPSPHLQATLACYG